MARPLRSTPITGASSLLRAGPPARLATVLTASRSHPLGCSLSSTSDSIETRLPVFHARAADQAHAASMPGTAWPVIGHPPGSSRSPRPGHGSDAISFVTTRQQRFGFTHLPGPHLTPPGAVSTSLTTTVFSQRSMWRFEAPSRKATPKGQPSSPAQHRLLEASPTHQDLHSSFTAHTSSNTCNTGN